MSTGLSCQFTEYTPGKWYLILERWDSPKGGDCWLDYADAYGPFPTEDKADDFLRQHFANPGGSCSFPYEKPNTSDVLATLVAKAPENMKRYQNSSFGRYGRIFR